MAANCPASVKFERIRISKLDPDTNGPLVGALNGYVSDAQVLFRVANVVEAGAEVTQKNGGGRISATVKDDDEYKRADLQLQLCQPDMVVESMLTGGHAFIGASSAIGGVQAPRVGDALQNPVCLEGWTRAIDGNSGAIPTVTSPSVAYWHWVFPLTQGWVPGDFDLGDGVHLFQYNGRSEENSAITLNGPFNDWPTFIADEGGITASYGRFFDPNIPEATCARIAVPSGS